MDIVEQWREDDGDLLAHVEDDLRIGEFSMQETLSVEQCQSLIEAVQSWFANLPLEHYTADITSIEHYHSLPGEVYLIGAQLTEERTGMKFECSYLVERKEDGTIDPLVHDSYYKSTGWKLPY